MATFHTENVVGAVPAPAPSPPTAALFVSLVGSWRACEEMKKGKLHAPYPIRRPLGC